MDVDTKILHRSDLAEPRLLRLQANYLKFVRERDALIIDANSCFKRDNNFRYIPGLSLYVREEYVDKKLHVWELDFPQNHGLFIIESYDTTRNTRPLPTMVSGWKMILNAKKENSQELELQLKDRLRPILSRHPSALNRVENELLELQGDEKSLLVG